MDMDMDQSAQEDSRSVTMDTGHIDFGGSGGFTVDFRRDNSGKDLSKTKHGRAEGAMLPSMSPGKVECSQSSGAAESFNVGGELGLRPSLLDDVLSDKKMALMRSPEVIRFLQTQQAKISSQKGQSSQTENIDSIRGDKS
ncbi:regulatory factor X-associated protein-like [Argopecten irradians]|uniref:regulatory factor X-associated protein-like n=1 Tax=Argopecten irradians TaxID=31199 RepID=UPI00371DE403